MKTLSCRALVMPITFTGLQALSVLIPTTVSTAYPFSIIALTMFTAPIQLDKIAWSGKYSQTGTCFKAAALKITSESLIAEQIS